MCNIHTLLRVKLLVLMMLLLLFVCFWVFWGKSERLLEKSMLLADIFARSLCLQTSCMQFTMKKNPQFRFVSCICKVLGSVAITSEDESSTDNSVLLRSVFHRHHREDAIYISTKPNSPYCLVSRNR